jgi:hypothetical protein
MPKDLVVVRWHGEIVGTEDAIPAHLAVGVEGVTTEVVDVSAERASSSFFRPVLDVAPLAMFVASIMVHVFVGTALVVGAALFSSENLARLLGSFLAPVNDKGAAVADPVIKVAPGESAEPQPAAPAEPQPPIPTQTSPEQPPEAAEVDAPSVPPETVQESTRPEDSIEGQSGTDDVSASPSTCVPPRAVVTKGPSCQRKVVFEAIEKSVGCYVDTAAKQGDEGTLTFPCNGDGQATLRFGRKSFVGAVVDGKLDVCTGTEYTYPPIDSCKWTSAQRISGSIGSGQLSFTYGEAPKPNQVNCAMSCGARATIKVR